MLVPPGLQAKVALAAMDKIEAHPQKLVAVAVALVRQAQMRQGLPLVTAALV